MLARPVEQKFDEQNFRPLRETFFCLKLTKRITISLKPMNFDRYSIRFQFVLPKFHLIFSSSWRGLTCEVFPRVKVRDHVGGSKPRLGNRAVARLRGGIEISHSISY